MKVIIIGREKPLKRRRLSKVQYRIVPEDLYHPDFGKCRTYGIQVKTINISIMHDVSLDKSDVIHMTEIFNRCQLPPIHLLDVVSDMLP